MRRWSWTDWQAGREAAQRRLARIAGSFPRPYRRERPRSSDEARLLRERATPEHLIGPDNGPSTALGAAQAAEADEQAPLRDRAGT
jgi:hypothetical protein